MSNKFCTSCGAELSEETKFCTGCGAKVNEESAISSLDNTATNASENSKSVIASKAGIMKDFGIDESSIKAFIALAEGRRTAELERIAEEKRLKEEEQVSPTQFKLQLDYLRPSHQANESIDKDGLRTVYDENEAYLLGKPTEKAVGGWTLYLPGQSTSVFNEEQRTWFNPYAKLGSTLDFCVITNGEYVWR